MIRLVVFSRSRRGESGRAQEGLEIEGAWWSSVYHPGEPQRVGGDCVGARVVPYQSAVGPGSSI